jgi:hypothetical protein
MSVHKPRMSPDKIKTPVDLPRMRTRVLCLWGRIRKKSGGILRRPPDFLQDSGDMRRLLVDFGVGGSTFCGP